MNLQIQTKDSGSTIETEFSNKEKVEKSNLKSELLCLIVEHV